MYQVKVGIFGGETFSYLLPMLPFKCRDALYGRWAGDGFKE